MLQRFKFHRSNMLTAPSGRVAALKINVIRGGLEAETMRKSSGVPLSIVHSGNS